MGKALEEFKKCKNNLELKEDNVDGFFDDADVSLFAERSLQKFSNQTVTLNTSEATKGPAIIIKNIKDKNINALSTKALTGCMGLAIVGKNKENNELDVFFAHASHYDTETATIEKDNPMSVAKDFIDSHKDVRIFWGTDFSRSQISKDAAQQILSNAFGCWVRMNDCISSPSLTFFPKIPYAAPGNPAMAIDHIEKKMKNPSPRLKLDLDHYAEFSDTLTMQDKFVPDKKIISKLEEQITALEKRKNSLFHSLVSERNQCKLEVLKNVPKAYQVGNYDLLYYMADCAKRNEPPLEMPGAKETWKSRKKESYTKILVLEAQEDAFKKIYKAGEKGCGLSADQSIIHDANEFKQISASKSKPEYKI